MRATRTPLVRLTTAGLAMYYDLTRDRAVLRDIVRLKEHVFRDY